MRSVDRMDWRFTGAQTQRAHEQAQSQPVLKGQAAATRLQGTLGGALTAVEAAAAKTVGTSHKQLWI